MQWETKIIVLPKYFRHSASPDDDLEDSRDWRFYQIATYLGSFTFLAIQYETRWAALLPTASKHPEKSLISADQKKKKICGPSSVSESGPKRRGLRLPARAGDTSPTLLKPHSGLRACDKQVRG